MLLAAVGLTEGAGRGTVYAMVMSMNRVHTRGECCSALTQIP